MLLDNLWGHTLVEVDDTFYFSAADFNGLFKVDKYTGTTEFIGKFEGEELCQYNIHCYTYSNGKNIYFLPWRGHHLHILDTLTGKMEKIRVSKASEKIHIFMDVKVDGDVIYLHSRIGEVYTIRCDIKKKKAYECDVNEMKGRSFEFAKKNEVYLQCIDRSSERDFYDFVMWYPYGQDRVYTLDPYGNHILIFSEKTKEIKKIELKIHNEQEYNVLKTEIKQANTNANVVYENEEGWQLGDFISFVNR